MTTKRSAKWSGKSCHRATAAGQCAGLAEGRPDGLDMLRTQGQGESTKWIIPMEFANVAKSIGDRLMAMTGSSGSADGEGRSS